MKNKSAQTFFNEKDLIFENLASKFLLEGATLRYALFENFVQPLRSFLQNIPELTPEILQNYSNLLIETKLKLPQNFEFDITEKEFHSLEELTQDINNKISILDNFVENSQIYKSSFEFESKYWNFKFNLQDAFFNLHVFKSKLKDLPRDIQFALKLFQEGYKSEQYVDKHFKIVCDKNLNIMTEKSIFKSKNSKFSFLENKLIEIKEYEISRFLNSLDPRFQNYPQKILLDTYFTALRRQNKEKVCQYLNKYRRFPFREHTIQEITNI